MVTQLPTPLTAKNVSISFAQTMSSIAYSWIYSMSIFLASVAELTNGLQDALAQRI